MHSSDISTNDKNTWDYHAQHAFAIGSDKLAQEARNKREAMGAGAVVCRGNLPTHGNKNAEPTEIFYMKRSDVEKNYPNQETLDLIEFCPKDKFICIMDTGEPVTSEHPARTFICSFSR